MPRDVADAERETAAVERDHVVPIAAHLGLRARGQVAGRNSHAGDRGQRQRQQAPLQRLGDAVLVLVQPGVVDRERGPVRDEAEQPLLLVGELALAERPHVHHADHAALGHQGRPHQRREAQLAQGGAR